MRIEVQTRKKMIAAVERGEPVASVARRFEVTERGLRKLIARCARRGSVEPDKPGPKGPTKLTPADDATMLSLIHAHPGITLKDIAAKLSAGVVESTVSRRLKRLGITLKKSLIAHEQRRPDVARRRESFVIASRFVDPDHLVFLDESGASTSMTRLYGRAARGVRCRFHAPHGHWKTTTMVSAIRRLGVIEPATMLLDGPMNADTFLGYVGSCLAPSLREGDVVVMDNLASHKVAGVEAAIEAAGATVWWLPPYSPDLNPIEKLWSKIKCGLRRAGARTLDALTHAAGDAFRSVAADECANYFRSCGYGT